MEELLQYRVDKVGIKWCAVSGAGGVEKEKGVSLSLHQTTSFPSIKRVVPGCIIELSLTPLCRTDLQRQPKIPGFPHWFSRTQRRRATPGRPLHSHCVPSCSSSNHLVYSSIFTASPFVNISVSFLDPHMIWPCAMQGYQRGR